MKYFNSILAVAGAISCVFLTATPSFADPTGTITTNDLKVKTYPPDANGYQRTPMVEVTVKFTVDNSAASTQSKVDLTAMVSSDKDYPTPYGGHFNSGSNYYVLAGASYTDTLQSDNIVLYSHANYRSIATLGYFPTA